MPLSDHSLLILDGACGTNLQQIPIPASAWQGREGCNEWLNVTAPEVIEGLHRRFVEAGAQVIETNTFGANAIVLSEYGLESRVAEINRAAAESARRAVGGRPDRFVAGSVGPGTKLASLSQVGVDALDRAYREQIEALVEGGVDALLIETCQDLLQVKTAVIAALEIVGRAGRDIAVMVSVTMEASDTMLLGTDIGAVCATLEPFPLFSLGLNCATGPDAMESHLRYLAENWPGRISCHPNAGLPEVEGGRTVYKLGPDAFASAMRRLVERYRVSIAGGCCGTTPDHIAALARALEGVRPSAGAFGT